MECNSLDEIKINLIRTITRILWLLLPPSLCCICLFHPLPCPSLPFPYISLISLLTFHSHLTLSVMFSSFPPLLSSSLISLFLVAAALLVCITNAAGPTSPTKIGNGYRLISVAESHDGGLVGHLEVKQKNNIYGPDIPLLRLYVKYVWHINNIPTITPIFLFFALLISCLAPP